MVRSHKYDLKSLKITWHLPYYHTYFIAFLDFTSFPHFGHIDSPAGAPNPEIWWSGLGPENPRLGSDKLSRAKKWVPDSGSKSNSVLSHFRFCRAPGPKSSKSNLPEQKKPFFGPGYGHQYCGFLVVPFWPLGSSSKKQWILTHFL